MHLKRSIIGFTVSIGFFVLAIISKAFFHRGYLAFGLLCGGLICYFRYFLKTAPQEEEQSCSMVSCCHYLGEESEK